MRDPIQIEVYSRPGCHLCDDAKTVMEEMYSTGKDPQQIIEEKGLVQISNSDEIEKIAAKVIEENPKPVEQYRLGKTGNFDGQDFLEMIVEQPQAGRYITSKIWKFFAGDDP